MSKHRNTATTLTTDPPRPRPRILNTDDAVPALHRAVVYNALARIDYAVRELDGILRTYGASDPRALDLRHAATRLDLALHIGHSWLLCHPAQEDQA